mgnify:CR=1 FL=1
MAIKLRTVIEEISVSKIIDSAIAQYPRIGDIFDGVKWRLARDPRCGLKIPDHECYRIVKTESFHNDLPSMSFLYKYDENNIFIKAIKINI